MEEIVSPRQLSRSIVIYLLLAVLAPVFLINLIPPRQWMQGVPPADARLNVWAMTWQWRVLPRDPGIIWDGNAFFPARNSITGSDHLFTEVLTGLPVYKLTRNPFLSYHFVLFAGYALSAWGMFLLGLTLFRHPSPALAAAVFFTVALPRSIHATGHIQIAYLGWMPWSVFFLHRMYHRTNFVSFAGFVITTVLHLLSGWYMAVFHVVILAVMLPSLAIRHRQSGAFYLSIAAIAIVALLVSPFAVPYLNRPKENFDAWNLYSAEVMDFVSPASYTLFGDHQPAPKMWSETTVWMGLTAPVLAVVGVLIRGKKDRMGRRPPVITYALLTLIGFSLALGTNFPGLPQHLTPWMLLSHLPGFGGIRVPARAVFICIFAISILFGRTIHLIHKQWPGKKTASALVVLIVAGMMTENFALARLKPSKIKVPEVYRWLQTLPVNMAVAEAPCFYGSELWAFSADYMMFAAIHGHPIANGYSRYIPPAYPDIAAAINRLPSPESIRFLKQLGIDFVVIHPQMYFDDYMRDLMAQIAVSEDPIGVFNRIIDLSNGNYSSMFSSRGLAMEIACLQSPFMDLVDRFGRDLVFYLKDLQSVSGPGSPSAIGEGWFMPFRVVQGSQPNAMESISPSNSLNS